MKHIYLALSIFIFSFSCIAEEAKPDIEFTEWGYVVINKASDQALKALKKYDKKDTVRIDFGVKATQADFDTIIKNNTWIKNLSTAMWNENINNIEAVSKLKSLQTIKLSSLKMSEQNPISLTPLEKLTNLIKVDLYGTHVTNTGALSKLVKLEDVSFYMSEIDSIDFLKNTPNVKKLSLYGKHSFKDYSPVSTLKSLEVLDTYMNSQATDENLAVLKDLTTLKKIGLSQNKKITNLNFLKGNLNLTDLEASWCVNLTDISALKDMQSLKLITLTDTPITQLSVLEGKKQLAFLYISGSKVKDITSLSGLVNLQHLDISKTEVNDVAILSGFDQLTELKMSHTKVKDITSLSTLSNLVYLDISHTEVTDITPLLKLKKLQAIQTDKKLPSDQIEKLKKALPDTQISID